MTFKTYTKSNEMKIHNSISELATYCQVSKQEARRAFYQGVCTLNDIKVINYSNQENTMTEPKHITLTVNEIVEIVDNLTEEICFSFNMKSILIENQHLIPALKEFSDKCKESRK